jgi:polyhydroxyalkanoate synthase subunit PhaC
MMQHTNHLYLEELIINFTKISEQYLLIADKLMAKQSSKSFAMNSLQNLADAATKVMMEIFTKPDTLIKHQMNYADNALKLINHTLLRLMGEHNNAIYQPLAKDARFKDALWQENLIYDFIKQSYIMTGETIKQMVKEVENISPKTMMKADFFIKQLIDALAPTNFVLTNPIVLKETLVSNGENLVRGMHKLLQDIENESCFFNTPNHNPAAFKVGLNLATTKGKVIYENQLMQLINYTPLKADTFSIPLLIVPPCINKYYILDLSEEKSCIKWLLEQGYNVFMISWINPDKTLAAKTFEDYILEGPLEAIAFIKEKLNIHKINVMGYCIGGTILAVAMSYLKAINDEVINAATFMATLVDFANPGDLAIFMDEQQLEIIDQQIAQDGFFPGSHMQEIFNLLRANEMIWQYFINNYLLGKEPMPFDILYWNDDSTRLPASMHSFYLRNMYQQNNLIKNAINIQGISINLKNITQDCYVLALKEDYITPWQGVMRIADFFAGKVKFTLAGSGHVAGVINMPNKNKYGYWTNPKHLAPEQWLNSATNHQGSWWLDWHKWMGKKSGKMTPHNAITNFISEAPGSYVKM